VLGVVYDQTPPSIDAKSHTVRVSRFSHTPDFTRFMAVRGARFEDGAMVVPYDDVEMPAKLILYGPAHLHVMMLKSRCPQLGPDENCKLHDSPDLPSTCRNYPLVLDDLLPECSYKKEPVE
jgi:hypothetical protein